ncbi:thioredoxin family protein [Flavobacterium salilacus subsp. salilacus]|uniref:thioredoxin family protein n=1 Tax=Flavobacterium TaxID=237 RepID=UPI0010752787|nr:MULTISPECIES: thioredoxin family protein [Flavobacterium]KAF2519109.1 thioredoxin family protein [Flavobacterium salilacus subsp. salilacus]MBE1613287.1 thioredoxin family protein [Flavobacterium sp. SaA2.13]
MKASKFLGFFTVVSLLTLNVACKESSNKEETDQTAETVEVADNTAEEAAEETRTGYKIGDVATDFSLKNTDGKNVALRDMADAKGYIVIFTCNHCPYAKAYEDRIIALDKKYKAKGYPVVAINPNNPEKMKDDSFEKMQERAKEKGFTFPYLLDDGQKIYPQYGATKTPHVYILQKTDNGNVVKYIGAIDDNYEDESAVEAKYVEDAVDALLAGKDVPVKETKAIGCSIKA